MTFWSMLPDTVEYGQHRTGVRAESFLFGLGQLFLKVALGVGAGAFGVALSHVGFVANVPQSPETLEGMRQIMVGFPMIALACGAIVMFFYPMRRGGHEAIVRELAAGEGARRGEP
jgi:GPH family glycoside/pentoside/hexuronide:cation symporter